MKTLATLLTTAVVTGVPLDSMIGITAGKPGFELLPYRTLTLK